MEHILLNFCSGLREFTTTLEGMIIVTLLLLFRVFDMLNITLTIIENRKFILLVARASNELRKSTYSLWISTLTKAKKKKKKKLVHFRGHVSILVSSFILPTVQRMAYTHIVPSSDSHFSWMGICLHLYISTFTNTKMLSTYLLSVKIKADGDMRLYQLNVPIAL